MKKNFLSFPAGVLCNDNIKLPIVFEDEHLLALSKPCDIFSTSDKFLDNSQRNIVNSINLYLSKPEFIKHEIKQAIALYELENCMSGAFVLAKNEQSGELLRNLFGSNLMTFTFKFVTIQNDMPKDKSCLCELPLAKHFYKDEVVISHKTGKKCSTEFLFIEKVGRYELWQAKCNYFRKHQLRAHAADFGLPILGESLYAQVTIPLASELKRFFKENRKEDSCNVIYNGLAAHLSNVSFYDAEHNINYDISCDLSDKFNVMLKFLGNSKK